MSKKCHLLQRNIVLKSCILLFCCTSSNNLWMRQGRSLNRKEFEMRAHITSTSTQLGNKQILKIHLQWNLQIQQRNYLCMQFAKMRLCGIYIIDIIDYYMQISWNINKKYFEFQCFSMFFCLENINIREIIVINNELNV